MQHSLNLIFEISNLPNIYIIYLYKYQLYIPSAICICIINLLFLFKNRNYYKKKIISKHFSSYLFLFYLKIVEIFIFINNH